MKDQQSAPAYIDENTKYEIVLDDENNCCLCGSNLKFNHQVDYLTLTIKEEAHCPSCNIQMKSREHVLQ